MPRIKKRLKIKTVIHRARAYLNVGKKAEAIDSILCRTDYTPTEAERLVEFIGFFYDIDSDIQIVIR